jgi:hypothetical protein
MPCKAMAHKNKLLYSSYVDSAELQVNFTNVHLSSSSVPLKISKAFVKICQIPQVCLNKF